MEAESLKNQIEKGKQLLYSGGLSNAQVLKAQELKGYNELPSSKPKKYYKFFLNVLKEPMVYLLFGCGITYFFLGDSQEAIMLLSFLVLIVAITIIQESKAERALDALKNLSSPRALVLREGQKIRIPGREVVEDDILFLNEGDLVPADALLLSGAHLNINESLVTGESVPVSKSLDSELFTGTTVVKGSGIAVAVKIGEQTQIGKIGQSIEEIGTISTKLEMQTNQLVKRLAWVALALCLLVFVFYSSSQHNWVQGSLVGLSLAMAILPNELPAVLTIFFALGAWRLSKRKVLTRKISAVENLGSITVLCVDKTGTLTLNQMTIQTIYSNNQLIDMSDENSKFLPEEFHEALEFGILASSRDPFDPMEIAFSNAGLKYLKGTEHLHTEWNLEKEYPLSPELLSITHAWKQDSGGAYIIGAKGAPEAIIDLCHLNSEDTLKINKQSEIMAAQGLRILGVAKASCQTEPLPLKQHDFEFVFLGLIGISDPIRSGVQESIAECHSAGIRVMMLTGDHPITASSIAKKIGLQNSDQVITGSHMETISDLELLTLTKSISVFSRVMPAQKLRLVNVLKNAGEIVAMTGDGVNDAPALKSSNVGIAMGSRGTDVARESAAIVLLDDDFTSIVEAIRMGRRIFANIKSALVYLFAIHIPIAGMSILPVLMGLPLVLLPAHIAFLHLIIEPASSIAFEIEPAGPELMKQKPRSPGQPLYNREIWQASLTRGLTLLIALLAVYKISLIRNQGEAEARALVFTTLILANTLLIFFSRFTRLSLKLKMTSPPNRVIKWLMLGSLLMLASVLYIPELRSLLKFSFLHPIDILICVGVSLASTLISELLLLIRVGEHRSDEVMRLSLPDKSQKQSRL